METHVRNAVVRAVHKTTSSSLRGRPRKLSIAETLQKIFYVCKTGCQWRAIEGMDGVSCKTVYHWFRKWSKARVFEHAFYNLVNAYGNVTFNPLVCDTSFVKNVFGHDVVGRNPTDRGRNATKVSLLTDSRGVPLAMTFHKANKSDFQSLGHLLQEGQRKIGRPFQMHGELYADKGYDSEQCRAICRTHGLVPCIPHRGEKSVWGGVRIAVEQCFGRIDKYRRCIMRYDYGIAQFKSFHYLAASCLVR